MKHPAPLTVQTSAHASADMFAGTEHATPLLQFTGTLARDAEVRVKPIGTDGHHVPVLCLELHHIGAGQHTVHAEQVHTEATRHLAEAAAARLKAGATVALTTPTHHLRLVLPFVEQIQLQALPSR